MSERAMPRYPVYIPSKGRADECKTARTLLDGGVPFRIVVEPQEYDRYAARYGEERVLTLPWDNPGSVIPARNWIKEHATAAGYERHWQIDDNVRKFGRIWRSRRLKCPPGPALKAAEDFTDRYENIAVSGLNYLTFAIPQRDSAKPKDPFQLNCHVYSCTLTLNTTPHRWRGPYNEDTDYCLQVLADGWCTVLFNAFWVDKQPTMTMKGGNAATLYQGDGRLRMARQLERQWPGVVTVSRKWGRPQHVVNWRKFDTPLRRKPGLELPTEPNEYGMVLKRVKPPKAKADHAPQAR